MCGQSLYQNRNHRVATRPFFCNLARKPAVKVGRATVNRKRSLSAWQGCSLLTDSEPIFECVRITRRKRALAIGRLASDGALWFLYQIAEKGVSCHI